MFSVHCPRHGADVLLGTDNIERVINTTTGVALRWRCTCGATGETRHHH
jgi:hypothetical protein